MFWVLDLAFFEQTALIPSWESKKKEEEQIGTATDN